MSLFEKDWLPLTKAPVNKQASKELWSWPEYRPEKKVSNMDWDLPIPFRALSSIEKKNPSIIDKTGARFGSFVVLGVFDGPKSNRGLRWVCRCVCGRYATRITKSINNQKNQADCCEHCRHLKYLKRNEEYRIFGRNIK